eukprot:gene15472-21557_t
MTPPNSKKRPRGGGDESSRSNEKAYESGDIELRFGNDQEPLRAHSQFLSLASPTVLAPMIEAEDPKASYLLYNFSKLLKDAARLVRTEDSWSRGHKTTEHTIGEWLWLIDELQLVGIHRAFRKLLTDLPLRRMLAIGEEVTAAAASKSCITAGGIELERMGRCEPLSVPKCVADHKKHIYDGQQDSDEDEDEVSDEDEDEVSDEDEDEDEVE